MRERRKSKTDITPTHTHWKTNKETIHWLNCTQFRRMNHWNGSWFTFVIFHVRTNFYCSVLFAHFFVCVHLSSRWKWWNASRTFGVMFLYASRHVREVRSELVCFVIWILFECQRRVYAMYGWKEEKDTMVLFNAYITLTQILYTHLLMLASEKEEAQINISVKKK